MVSERNIGVNLWSPGRMYPISQFVLLAHRTPTVSTGNLLFWGFRNPLISN